MKTNQPYSDRLKEHTQEKMNIAQAAAMIVPNGASLFLNIGTTTEAVAKALLDHTDLHIATNNLNVAMTLCQNPSFQIMIGGGQVRNHDGGVVGHKTTQFMNDYRLDIGIIGISGIDEDGTLLDFDLAEVKTSQIIIQNSKRVILVTDASKFGRRALFRVGSLSDIDDLVTDGAVPSSYKPLCHRANVNLIDVPHR